MLSAKKYRVCRKGDRCEWHWLNSVLCRWTWICCLVKVRLRVLNSRAWQPCLQYLFIPLCSSSGTTKTLFWSRKNWSLVQLLCKYYFQFLYGYKENNIKILWIESNCYKTFNASHLFQHCLPVHSCRRYALQVAKLGCLITAVVQNSSFDYMRIIMFWLYQIMIWFLQDSSIMIWYSRVKCFWKYTQIAEWDTMYLRIKIQFAMLR